MAFAGSIGPSAALIPFALIKNSQGEQAASYDAAGRIAFTRAGGQVYTPDRVDTLFIAIATDQTPPLGITVTGLPLGASADTGLLVTGVPAANENGLPTNFGPGRGRWDGPTGQSRLRVTAEAIVDVTVVANAAGALAVSTGPVSAGNARAGVRNYSGEVVDSILLIVECLHSVQG